MEGSAQTSPPKQVLVGAAGRPEAQGPSLGLQHSREGQLVVAPRLYSPRPGWAPSPGSRGPKAQWEEDWEEATGSVPLKGRGSRGSRGPALVKGRPGSLPTIQLALWGPVTLSHRAVGRELSSHTGGCGELRPRPRVRSRPLAATSCSPEEVRGRTGVRGLSPSPTPGYVFR